MRFCESPGVRILRATGLREGELVKRFEFIHEENLDFERDRNGVKC